MQEGVEDRGTQQEGSSVVRLHVGGLGPAVISSDLLHTFSSLVRVSSVEVVRTKGRSFAYVTIQAASHDIKRLFSRYNGCMWKGGRLKLEKAREHYIDKLHREWAERDSPQELNISKSDPVPPTRKAPNRKESSGIKIYFPKLRKVKIIPEKGLGKHKRSFERVEPLPHSLVRICNCDQDCLAVCNQSSTENLLLAWSKEERKEYTENSTIIKENPKNEPSYKGSGNKKNIISEEKKGNGDERGNEQVSVLDNLFLNIRGGTSTAEVGNDETESANNLDDLTLNITGSIHQNKEAQIKGTKPIHAQRKRLKVDQDSHSRKESRQGNRIDEGKILHAGEMKGSLQGRSWVQKASWKSLVGGAERMPFSLGSVLGQNNHSEDLT